MITKNQQVSLNDLWESASIDDMVFYPELLIDLPDLTRRYLEHAIAPGTPLASAVRLWMHGEIKIGKKWHSFKGEEVICWNRGMIWQAKTWMQGLPIWGADRIVDGVGEMQWKILGLFPVMQASGDDLTRSGVGRVQTELVWLPSVLCSPNVLWTELGASAVQAHFTAFKEPAKFTLTVNNRGMLERVKIDRWGNPEGEAFHYVDFGGIVEESSTFGGYTIPTRLRVGWYFGSDRFESDGEFFRCTIDKAIYR
ncbi:DUF6920 family protein [Coleofasciculus sp. H7-2]|uniref:DUF6920 family protein n=1 Tax=Coleofasciculus sp. H7-2 TaxID=3351545 RepID=UPI00366D65E9